MDILSQIIKCKKKEVKNNKERSFLNISDFVSPFPVKNFKSALKNKKGISLIAEIKKASPSAGIIKKDFNAVKIALKYAESGADAVSVLTDKNFFQGCIEYLKAVKEKVSIPVLRKDFIIDESQIYESFFNGADAVLLISEILTLKQIKSFLKTSFKLGIQCLVESHSRQALEKSIEAGAEIIGINNRNLSTFKTDIKNTLNLVKYIPEDKVKVAESGISSYNEIKLLEEAGLDAVLIGESLMKTDDIKLKINTLFGKTND